MKKELSMGDCKKIQLSILSYIDEVCTKNNLRYYLCGGTLIGAIRHKGYIPWDDDIDIMLPRTDYHKLINLLKADNKYRSLSMYNQPDYYYPFAKVVDLDTELIEYDLDIKIKDYGVYVDLFPLDGLPNSKNKIVAYYKKIMRARKAYYLAITSHYTPTNKLSISVVKLLAWCVAQTIGWKKLLNRVDSISKEYDFETAQYIGVPSAGYGSKEVFHKGIVEKALRVEFEEYRFNIPVGYDEYLTSIYGDYMKLPDENNRVTRHNFKAFSNVDDRN